MLELDKNTRKIRYWYWWDVAACMTFWHYYQLPMSSAVKHWKSCVKIRQSQNF